MNNNTDYYVVKIIVLDKKVSSFIKSLSDSEIKILVTYLNPETYSILQHYIYTLVNNDLTSHLEYIVNELITYYHMCDLDKDRLSKNLTITKLFLMNAGATNTSTNSDTKTKTKTDATENVVMKGIIVTLRSIVDRKFDKDKIDENLRIGAKARREIARMKKLKKSKKSGKTGSKTNKTSKTSKSGKTTKSNAPKSVTQEPVNTDIVKPINDKDVKEYKQAVEILQNVEPSNIMDKPLSQPLDVPPVGNTGSTIINVDKDVANTILNKPVDKQVVNTISNIPVDTPAPTSIKVGVVKAT